MRPMRHWRQVVLNGTTWMVHRKTKVRIKSNDVKHLTIQNNHQIKNLFST